MAFNYFLDRNRTLFYNAKAFLPSPESKLI